MRCILSFIFSLSFILSLSLWSGISCADGLTVWPENDADESDVFVSNAQHLRMNEIYDDLVKKREAERELERKNLEAIEALPFHGNFTE